MLSSKLFHAVYNEGDVRHDRTLQYQIKKHDPVPSILDPVHDPVPIKGRAYEMTPQSTTYEEAYGMTPMEAMHEQFAYSSDGSLADIEQRIAEYQATVNEKRLERAGDHCIPSTHRHITPQACFLSGSACAFSHSLLSLFPLHSASQP